MSLATEQIQQLVEPARVHSSVYADKEIFALEMDRTRDIAGFISVIIARSNDYFSTTVATLPVLLSRDAKTG